MLHPAHRVGPIAAFEPLYLALAQLQQPLHSQSPSLAETLSDSSPPSLEGDRISLQLGGDIILEHLHANFLMLILPLVKHRIPSTYVQIGVLVEGSTAEHSYPRSQLLNLLVRNRFMLGRFSPPVRENAPL